MHVPARIRIPAFLSVCAAAGLAVGLAIRTVAPDAPTGSGAVSDVNASLLNPSMPFSYHDGIMLAAPSVVSVFTREISDPPAPNDPQRRLDTTQGSGVIVAEEGVVLTNLHLVDRADSINVLLSDGTAHAAELVGSDRETDLAVVRIDVGGLPAMALDAAPPLRVGDIVLAIGNPYGVGQTVTQGIVSATRRRIEGGSAWQNFVQIDAAINPGNSGGALIDALGRLVGVNTAVFLRDGGAQGIGFAIPADLLAQVVPQIIADGRVVRGWLGIGADDPAMFPRVPNLPERGAVITDVFPASPAARAGLRPRDVVVSVDGEPIVGATGLLLTISALAPGASVGLDVLRDGNVRTIKATLAERPPAKTLPPPR